MRKLMLGGGLLAASSLLLGCPNPNTYGTPRTVQKGQISHTVALEGIYVGGTTTTTTTNPDRSVTTKKEDVGVGLPMLPSYQLRYGITDNLDFGVGIRNLSSLQGDLKFNFLRSELIDLAVAPGVQYFGIFTGDGTAHVFYMHLPALVGLNLSDNFSVVGSVGAVYAAALVSGTRSDDRNGVTSASGFLLRGGLGLNIRASKEFAIQPEISLMRAFNDAEGMFVVGGLGFTFGKHQHFKDTAPPPGSAPPGAAPGAAPASAPTPPPPPAAVTQ